MSEKETEQIKKALRLVEKWGYSYIKAAKETGVHRKTIARWAKKEGVISPHAKKLVSKKVFGVQVKPEPRLWQKIKKLLRL